jgi:hypothetical protein
MTTLTTKVEWLAEPTTCTVTFDLNGGTGTAPEAITELEGTMIQLPDTSATKTGFEFKGWAKTTDATAALPAQFELTEDTTLYAVWAPKKYNYTISNYFMGVDGNYPNDPSVETAEDFYGTEIALTADTVESYANFTFDPNAANVLTGTVDETETLNIAVYYSRNKYDITYIVDGATNKTASIFFGATIPEEAVPEKIGYKGEWVWTKTDDGSATIAPSTMPGYALTATANYADDIAEYTVKTYTMGTDGNYSEDVKTKTGRVGDTADATPANIPTGFELIDAELATGTISAANDLVLIVRLARKSFTVTYKVDGQDDVVETYIYGAAVTAIAVPKDGNGNDGIWVWSTGAKPNTMPAENVVATAKYPSKVVPAVYTMDVDGNYGDPTEGTPVYGDIGEKVNAVVGEIPTGFELDADKSVLEATIADDGSATLAIYFARKSYTITYKAEGQNDIVKTYRFEAQTETAPEVPELEGNTGSWDKETPATMPAENLVITAVYAINQYTITYKAEGENDIVKTYNYGATTEAAPAVPEKTGYNGAWDKETPTTMPAENLVITAVYNAKTYTITYKAEGQNDIVMSYEFGQNIDKDDIPAVPEKQGFSGSWDKATPATMPAEDLVITAIYDQNSYTVTYKQEGKDDIVETYVFGAAIAQAPQIDPRTGYSAAWVGEDDTTYTTMPAKNLVFNAVYTINNYTITFKIEGRDDVVKTYEYNAEISTDDIPVIPELDGKTGRWDNDVPTNMPAENLVITAVYDNNNYTITFKSGTDTIATETYEFGAVINKDAPAVPGIEGYNGTWVDAESKSYEEYKGTNMPAKNLVFNASYTKAMFTITFKAENQQDQVFEVEFGAKIEDAITIPEVPAKEGRTGNWVSTDGNSYVNMPAKDLVYEAQYANDTYTITYKAEGFDDIVKSYEFGAETDEAPAVPAKTGYTGNWNQETPATMPAQNLVITAVYNANDYTITYKAEGQDDIVKTYKFGAETEEAPAVPGKEGYNGAWDIATPATMPAENLVITAVYNANDYTITYKAEGQDDIVKTYKFGAETEEAPAVPGKEGYSGAWDKATPATMPAENLVITAVYNANNYTITYKAEGQDDIVKTYKFGAVTEAAPTVPAKTGYNGAWDAETPTTMPAENLVITAVYEKADFTITYIVGSEVLLVKTYKFEAETEEAPAVPPKTNFNGSWDTETPATMPAENLVIKAVYVEREYTITYVVDGETYLVKTYKFGQTTEAAPPVPGKIGFEGAWDASTPAVMPAENLVITAKYTVVGQSKKVWSASFDGSQLVIVADANADKVALYRTIDGTVYTWTYIKSNSRVSTTIDAETGREIWTISDVNLADGTYLARAKYGIKWTDTEDSFAYTVYNVEVRVPMSIVSVTPDEKYDGNTVKTIKVVTIGGPDKLQIRKIVGESINTWTYNRDNATVTAIDDKGTEEWTINVGLAQGDYTMYAKAYSEWEYITPLDFTVNYWVVSEQFGVKSATVVDSNTIQIVVIGGADKVQLVAANGGTYTYAKSFVTVTTDSEDPTIETWTINASLAAGTYKINIKRNAAWTVATEETPTLVVSAVD